MTPFAVWAITLVGYHYTRDAHLRGSTLPLQMASHYPSTWDLTMAVEEQPMRNVTPAPHKRHLGTSVSSTRTWPCPLR